MTERAPLSALEWLRVTHADTLSGRRIEEAVAEAEARGRMTIGMPPVVDWLVDLTVFGTPGPQGSKRVLPLGAKAGATDHVVVESSKKVKPWRRAIVDAARSAGFGRGGTLLPLGGALIGDVVFTLHRGKTVKRPLPTVYPDLSKLLRSTEDALSTAGVWTDDATLVDYVRLRKVYVGHPDGLEQPGARIRIGFHPETVTR